MNESTKRLFDAERVKQCMASAAHIALEPELYFARVAAQRRGETRDPECVTGRRVERTNDPLIRSYFA